MSLSSKIIKIGTRASNLALKQVEEVKSLLQSYFPQIKIEIVPITTSGDKIQDRNLAEIGGKGLFIKELEEALILNKIDVAVHSAKDVPPILHEKTYLAAFTKRLDARDCFISNKFNSIKDLPNGSVIGTSSARRKAILLNIRPDLKIVNLRGNVDTRLNKIALEEMDGSILALCGLTRIDKTDKIKEIISDEIMLPAGGQGALALQIRNDDEELFKIVTKVNHKETQICVKSERAFLRELEASCVTPVAAFAKIENNLLHLKTAIFDYEGEEVFEVSLNSAPKLEDGIALGIEAAQKTKNQAKNLLNKIIKQN